MNLENEIANVIAKQMKQEIDDGVSITLLENLGWKSTRIRYKNNEHAVDILYWLENNCTGEYRRMGGFIVFEKTQDLEWFILRWK